MLLPCPRCDDLNGHLLELCSSCGARLVVRPRPSPYSKHGSRSRVGTPEQKQAVAKVQQAIATGVLVRGECAHADRGECSTRGIDGHHEDYGKPLDVIWLCRRHHQLLHSEKRRLKREAA